MKGQNLSLKDIFQDKISDLPIAPGARFLVTGAAGFIGSHVCETLIQLGHEVVGLDNFSTGKPENINFLKKLPKKKQTTQFTFIEGDIRNQDTCRKLVSEANFVIHMAALGSVPRSIESPRNTIETNINGFFNIIDATKDSPGTRLIFASSSSVYGNDRSLPKKEGVFGNVLSPYAASKRADELISEAYANCYPIDVIGLRFFNVFGERQNPTGPYAAVIPKWTTSLLSDNDNCLIFGDGETSRDFTYVKNVVYGILLACTSTSKEAMGKTFNIACGGSTTLNELFELLKMALGKVHPSVKDVKPLYQDFRLGDIRHSTSDISLISNLLGYEPLYTVAEGLELSAPDFVEQYGNTNGK